MGGPITIRLETEDIYNGLLTVIDLDVKNRKDIAKLLGDLIADNDRATQYFVKMLTGAAYPKLPTVGNEGYFKLDDHRYGLSDNVRASLAHSPLNQHGFIPCTVIEVGPIHMWSPLTVRFPDVEKPGEFINIGLRIEQYYSASDTDIYDDLPI